jgi:hypothetical protein
MASPEWNVFGATSAAKQDFTACSVPGNPQARRFTFSGGGGDTLIQLMQPVPAGITPGTRMRIAFWGRSKMPARVSLVFEEKDPPYTRLYSHEYTLTTEWKEYSETATFANAVKPNTMKLDVQMAPSQNEMEFTGFSMTPAK